MRRSVIAAAVAVLCASAAWGSGSLRMDAYYQAWEWEQSAGGPTTDLNEYTFRAILGFDLSPELLLEISGAAYGAEWSGFMTGGDTQDLSGFTDTHLRLTWTVNPNLMARVGVGIPTGTTSLTSSEFALTQALAARILEMQTNRVGEGVAADVGLAYAFRLSSIVSAGVGLGYLHKETYTVIEGTPDFRPGSQLSLSGGLDVAPAGWLWRSNVRAIFYGDDEFSDTAFQQEGQRWELHTSLLRRWTKTSAWVSAFFVYFGNAKSGDPLSKEPEARRGPELYGELGLRRQLSNTVHAGIRGGYRDMDSNGYDLAGAQRMDLDLILGLTPSPSVKLELTGGYRTGTLRDPHPLLGNTSEADLSGFIGEFSFTYGF